MALFLAALLATVLVLYPLCALAYIGIAYFFTGEAPRPPSSPSEFIFMSDDITNQIVTTALSLISAAVGAGLTYYFEGRRAKEDRELDRTATEEALYMEMSDLAARCCFDYDAPWKHYVPAGPTPDPRSLTDVTKFSPGDITVYASLGSGLGTLHADARPSVVRFYSALERWRREINDLRAEAPETVAGSRLVRLQRRLGETLSSALAALEALGKHVPIAEEIDATHMDSYYTLAIDDERVARIGRDTLRQTLAELAAVARAGKDAEANILRARRRQGGALNR